MNLLETIDRNLALFEWMDQPMDHLPVQPGNRSRVALGCLQLALEHGTSIVLLSQYNFIGTASALIRVMLEAYVRGIWVQYSAEDQEVESFLRDSVPKLSELLKRVAQVEAFDVEVFEAIRQQHLKTMHSLTHTGYAQVSRRQKEFEIVANYDEDECIEIVEFAAALRCCTAISVCCIANRLDLANEIVGKLKELWPMATK